MRPIAVVILLVLSTGCAASRVEHPRGPVVIHVSGIQGQTVVDKLWLDRVSEQLDATPEQYHWTSTDHWMVGALQAVDKNRAEAAKLAGRLTQLRRTEPGRKIVLSGHSGGAGFAVFALEQLPPDVHIDHFVMLSPAISPDYDLSVALSHVRGTAYAFCSEYDALILGAGTNTFGTMDGRRESSAGMVGFAFPEKADRIQYAKLVTLTYRTSWARYSNFGDHFGPISPAFGQKVIGPLLATGMLRQ